MFEGLSIGGYLLLVDYTGRLFREGKARISAELAAILDRIGNSADSWQRRMERLKNGRWFGRFFTLVARSYARWPASLNVRRVINLAGKARKAAVNRRSRFATTRVSPRLPTGVGVSADVRV